MASANVSRPRSRGSIKIASSDPLAAPLIDPNYFADPEDMRTARAALRIARELISMPAFDAFRGPEYAPGADVQSEIGRATSELQSLMRIPYAVFCLKKKKTNNNIYPAPY